MQWKRYRFVTTTQEDVRPLVFNPAYPWWISGETGDGQWTVIVAYLPADEPLERYWDDTDEVDYTDEAAITFSSRFPKPEYYREQPKVSDVALKLLYDPIIKNTEKKLRKLQGRKGASDGE